MFSIYHSLFLFQEPDIIWVNHRCMQRIQFVLCHRNFSRFGTLVALANVICITVSIGYSDKNLNILTCSRYNHYNQTAPEPGCGVTS
jgi:hypothetical protein